MPLQETRDVVEGLLASMAGHWLAETVEMEEGPRTEPRRGRHDVAIRLRELLSAGADENELTLTLADGRAAVESSTRRLALALDVEAGEVVRVRVYRMSDRRRGEQ